MCPAKLPVEVEPVEGGCMMAVMMRIFRMMPASMRKSAVSKDGAPDPAKVGTVKRDLHDAFGENPYTIEETVPGKVWHVLYTYEDATMTDPKARADAAKWGIDPNSEKWRQKVLAGAESHGPQAVEACRQDIERFKEWSKRNEFTEEEIRKTFSEELSMAVVKLNSGGLLLYCPVMIREEHGFRAWLEGLGKVEWIVVGSCFHTNYLAGVFKLYPEAKVIGTPASQDKVKLVKGLPRDKYDYNAQDPDQLSHLNSILEKEGATVYYVTGDVGCNSVSVICHKVLLTADLVYGAADGGGCFGINKDDILKGDDKASLRLFRFLLMSNPHTPNGALASYRYKIGSLIF